MDLKIFDDFLSYDNFEQLKTNICSINFPWFYQSELNPIGFDDVVAYRNDDDHQWDWYHTHKLYDNDKIASEFFEPVYNMIIPKIREVSEYHSLMRIKVNSYPNTKIINEHDQHSDYQFSSYGGILSLNTCNGFTRLHDGTKVDSIENRFFIFDPSKPHNSSTTTNTKRRVNINFNWI